MEETILYFALNTRGDFDKIYTALETKGESGWNIKIKLFKKLKSKLYNTHIKNYLNA